MTKSKLFTTAAILAAVIATPAMAKKKVHHTMRAHTEAQYDTQYRNRGSGFWPADAAAGIVGGAVGTAGAIATAPFRAFDNSYAYNGDPYAHRRGRASCGPWQGATFMGPDGQWYPCP
jgi:hypothetical protein